MNPPTKIQQSIYDYCLRYLKAEQQFPPTRTIQAAFKYKSQTAVMGHLNALVRKGLICYNQNGRFKFTNRSVDR